MSLAINIKRDKEIPSGSQRSMWKVVRHACEEQSFPQEIYRSHLIILRERSSGFTFQQSQKENKDPMQGQNAQPLWGTCSRLRTASVCKLSVLGLSVSHKNPSIPTYKQNMWGSYDLYTTTHSHLLLLSNQRKINNNICQKPALCSAEC